QFGGGGGLGHGAQADVICRFFKPGRGSMWSAMTTELIRDLASGALSEAIADIAEAAAAVVLPYWRNGVTAEAKADDSPVTRADREAEALILAALADRWPGVQAVGEEQ